MKPVFILFCLVLLQSKILPLNDETIKEIFQTDTSAVLFLLTDDSESSSKAKTVFENFDQTNPAVNLSTCDKNDGSGYFQPVAFSLGVNPDNMPLVMYTTTAGQKYIYKEEITVEGLTEFVRGILAGEEPKYYKSAQSPKENNGPVIEIVGNTYWEKVIRSKEEFLVMIYSPGCGHCKHFLPRFQKAAKILTPNKNIKLGQIDAFMNDVQGVQFEAYPTILFYQKNKEMQPIKYDGKRTVVGVIQWLKEHTEFEWVELGEIEELTEEEDEQFGKRGQMGQESKEQAQEQL